MVSPTAFWAIQLDKAILRTKIRIKHCETHGIGNSAMQEKAILKLQERTKELRK